MKRQDLKKEYRDAIRMLKEADRRYSLAKWQLCSFGKAADVILELAQANRKRTVRHAYLAKKRDAQS